MYRNKLEKVLRERCLYIGRAEECSGFHVEDQEDTRSACSFLGSPQEIIDEVCNFVPASWDQFYLGLAEFISTKSKDPYTKSGAVIVRPDNSVCSVGFNGFPKKMQDKPEWYADREFKYKVIIHCEMNALNFSRDQSHDGYTLYTYPFLSCNRCFVHMVQAGITRFVSPKCPDHLKDRWEASFQEVRKLAEEMSIKIDELEFY